MTRPPRLSPREIECLRALADGEGPKQIAHRLGLSIRTCEHYVLGARRKLRAKNTTHAVVLAIEHGLLTPKWAFDSRGV